jgi:hypothetical protein
MTAERAACDGHKIPFAGRWALRQDLWRVIQNFCDGPAAVAAIVQPAERLVQESFREKAYW